MSDSPHTPEIRENSTSNDSKVKNFKQRIIDTTTVAVVVIKIVTTSVTLEVHP